MTDVDLVARARQGDPAAFGELVDRHRTAVFRAALAALGTQPDSRDAAEDVTQEAFLLAYRRLDSFRGDASFKTWLLTIAWNQAINHRRSLVRLLKRLAAPAAGADHDETLAAVAAPNPTPEDAAAHDQLKRAIQREIRALTPKLRDALLLAQSGAYTYEEIAAMTGAPLGTIKWRVSEARRVIKTRLRGRGYERL